MKTKFRYSFIIPIALAFSIPKANAQASLIQYWDFNQIRPITGTGGDSLGTAYSYLNALPVDSAMSTWPLTADYTAGSLTKGRILYSRPTTLYSPNGRDSIIDGQGPGGSFIYDYSQSNDSGFALGNGYLKLRNPSDSCVIFMSIPTTGYKNISMEYAISQSSSKGAQYNVLSYSTNGGATWNNLTTAMDTFNIGGVYRPDTLQMQNPVTVVSGWYPVQINFSSDPSINNNPLFIVKMLIAGTTTSTLASGNDRYDNFAVWGSVITGINNLSADAAGYNVYPNPANDMINIVSDRYIGDKIITLYNLVGQTVTVAENKEKQTALNTSALTPGVYFAEIKEVSTGNKYTVKIVKE